MGIKEANSLQLMNPIRNLLRPNLWDPMERFLISIRMISRLWEKLDS